jgi:hypothetical protein
MLINIKTGNNKWRHDLLLNNSLNESNDFFNLKGDIIDA